MNKRQIGMQREQLAAEYLKAQGYTILVMNFRCRIGEIDMIASKDQVVHFVEVKYRSSAVYGTAAEAVNSKKQNTIRKVAQYYLVTVLHSTSIACCFDVIAFDQDEVTMIIDAF